MSEPLHDRWCELVQAIEKQCVAHGQHPGGGVLEANESLLKVSMPSDGGVRFSQRFEEREVLDGNLQALASNFYASYRVERGEG